MHLLSGGSGGRCRTLISRTKTLRPAVGRLPSGWSVGRVNGYRPHYSWVEATRVSVNTLTPWSSRRVLTPRAFSLATRRSSAELLLRWRHRLDSHQRGPGCNRVPQSSVTVPGLRRRASNPRRRWLTATRSSAELLRTAEGSHRLPPYRHGVPTPGFRAENPADFLYPMAAW